MNDVTGASTGASRDAVDAAFVVYRLEEAGATQQVTKDADKQE